MRFTMTTRGCPGYLKSILSCLALMIVFIPGCAAREVYPHSAPDKEHNQVFQVVKHGWHVGIVVDKDEMASEGPLSCEGFSGAEHLEIGWGDARFYQAAEPSASLALRAALWPTASVIHIVGFSGDPANYFPASEVVDICVSRSEYKRMLDYIMESFKCRPDGGVIPLGPGLYGTSRFYKAKVLFTSSTPATPGRRGLSPLPAGLFPPRSLLLEGFFHNFVATVVTDLHAPEVLRPQ